MGKQQSYTKTLERGEKMSTRRDNGSGSIRLRSNNSWEGRYSYIDEDTGKRIAKSVYASTKPEVKRKLKNLIDQIENFDNQSGDEYIESNNIKLNEWLDTWMKEYKKGSIRTTTYNSYHNCIELHIRPALGNIELQKLRPDHIQKLLNDLSRGTKKKEPLSSATVIKVKNVLSGALEQAIRNQMIPYNPARAAAPPKLVQKEIRIMTVEEQKKFTDAIKGHRLEALFKLALATGMRRGEIIALTWNCINWKNNSINIKGSVSREKDPDSGKTELCFSEPKTKHGKRQVPILPNMLPVLKAHKERQEAEKALAGSAWNQKNLVFCSSVGTVIEPRRIRTTMKKITDAANMDPITFHALRHTFATRMLEANVPAKVVQEILGHADITLTLNTYSHVIGTTAHEQIAKINDLFKDDEISDIVNATDNQSNQKPSIKEKLETAKQEVNKNKKTRPQKALEKNAQAI